MKRFRILFATLALLLAQAPLYGQETETKVNKGAETVKETGREQTQVKEEHPETPLKVQIVITEFDGTKEISRLPYSLNLLGTHLQNRKEAHLRFGVRVPISTGNGYTYQDVGTNIDATALQRDDGTYRVDLTVDRSSVTMPMNGADWKPGDTNPSTQPLIRSFRDDFTVVATPDHPVQGTSAVDPVTGHVVKVEVTLSVEK
jgi:hypothetical protein